MSVYYKRLRNLEKYGSLDSSGGIQPDTRKKSMKRIRRFNETWEIQEGHCYYCHQKMLVGDPRHPRSPTWDHMTPLSRGGTSRIENLVLACYECNQKKGDRTREEYSLWVRIQSGFFSPGKSEISRGNCNSGSSKA